jgi:hypothetical protein
LIQEELNMTQKTKSVQGAVRPIAQVVLFGLDDNGKPKAARFSEPQADIATKAAAQLKLRVLAVSNANIAELAARLPSGRVHANGKGFIPTIRRDLYSKLLQASGEPSGTQSTTTNASNQAALKLPSKQPQNWAEIAPGHFVIIQDDDPKDGWWEAIVVGVAADMLSLRWRAASRGRPVARHRNNVALMHPETVNPSVEKSAPATKGGQSNPKKGGEATASTPKSAYPRDWTEIRLDHVVLAREDGPLSQWWEALVISQQDDTFTLRWRDYADLPTITRPRQELALLHASSK